MKKIPKKKKVIWWGLLWTNSLMKVYRTRRESKKDSWSEKHRVVKIEITYDI